MLRVAANTSLPIGELLRACCMGLFILWPRKKHKEKISVNLARRQESVKRGKRYRKHRFNARGRQAKRACPKIKGVLIGGDGRQSNVKKSMQKSLSYDKTTPTTTNQKKRVS